MYKEKKPLTVILIGVMDGNRILLAKRKREPYAGYYGLIGGRQTFGEEMRTIAKQEVLDETGYAIHDVMHIKGAYSEIFLDTKGKPKDHFLFVVAKAQLNKGKQQSTELENTDIEKSRWFDLPLSKEDREKIIPTDILMMDNFYSDHVNFKEFILQQIPDNPHKLKLVKVIDEAPSVRSEK
jgi:ADP-ribose pyrophosphatase YjhB (NUDIX family)